MSEILLNLKICLPLMSWFNSSSSPTERTHLKQLWSLAALNLVKGPTRVRGWRADEPYHVHIHSERDSVFPKSVCSPSHNESTPRKLHCHDFASWPPAPASEGFPTCRLRPSPFSDSARRNPSAAEAKLLSVAQQVGVLRSQGSPLRESCTLKSSIHSNIQKFFWNRSKVILKDLCKLIVR
jgi:hypothetical protein